MVNETRKCINLPGHTLKVLGIKAIQEIILQLHNQVTTYQLLHQNLAQE